MSGQAGAPDGCDACLRRAWLLARLSGHLDQHRDRVPALLALADGELIAALGGGRRAEIEREFVRFDPRRGPRAGAG